MIYSRQRTSQSCSILALQREREQITPEMLYKEYRGTVLRNISARIPSWEDAEDLCEEVFTKLIKLLDSYDENKAAISTLVYKFSHDIVIDYYRRNRRIILNGLGNGIGSGIFEISPKGRR